jgi:hypothetical protein
MRPSFHRTVISAFALAGCLAAVRPAHAQPTDATGLSGLWRGTYVCSQGETALELDLRGNAYGIVRGTFAFSATARNRGVPSGSYPVLGRMSGTSLVLRPIDVREMPGTYVPVGIQATVAPGEERIEGWIEGPTCGALRVDRTSSSASADPLPGGYGEQEWVPVAESRDGILYMDGRAFPGTRSSTARRWTRWESALDIPETGLQAGQALEWDMEFDCPAQLVRVWYSIVYDTDGEMRYVDALAPYRWQPVVAGTLDEHACQDAR